MQPAEASREFKARINAAGACIVLLVITGVLLAGRSRTDVDLGLHLAIGRSIVQEGLTLGTSSLDSLTVLQDRAYVPTQWLAQVVGYGAWSAAGYGGIASLRLLCLTSIIAATLWGNRSLASPTAAVIATTVTVFGSAMAWGERPQLAGLCAFAITSAALWRSSMHSIAISWLTVPVIWIWAMLHGTWILGLGLLSIFTLGGILAKDWRRSAHYGAQSLLGLLSTVVNPLGIATLTAPFTVLGSTRQVREWQTPALTNPLVIALIIAFVIVVIAGRRKSFSATHVLVLIFSVVLVLSMVRLVAFGAVALSPLLADAISRSKLEWSLRVERLLWGSLAVGGGAVAATVAFATTPSMPLDEELHDALNGITNTGGVAVEPRLSGWVMWSHPQLPVMMDLRAEAYTDATRQEYRDFTLAGEGWEAYACTHGIETIVVDADQPLASVLQTALRWERSAISSETQLWTRESPCAS